MSLIREMIKAHIHMCLSNKAKKYSVLIAEYSAE